jgi:hypothetical protein
VRNGFGFFVPASHLAAVPTILPNEQSLNVLLDPQRRLIRRVRGEWSIVRNPLLITHILSLSPLIFCPMQETSFTQNAAGPPHAQQPGGTAAPPQQTFTTDPAPGMQYDSSGRPWFRGSDGTWFSGQSFVS